MLTNSKNIFNLAMRKKFAIGQFNINNLEWTKVILECAKETNTPVIIGTSEGAIKYMGGVSVVYGIVSNLINELEITTPVVLHLDHGTSFESCKKAIDAGYTSVMFDGSELPISENIKITKQVVEYAKKHNVSVEAEVGTVGGSEDNIVSNIRYASLNECLLISKVGIDSLAASLGSVHGHYVGEPNLGFKEMGEYSLKTRLPLVLHGASGIPDDKIKKAISLGEVKININTEIQEAFAKGIRQYIEEELDKKSTGYDPRKIIGTYAYKNMKKTVLDKIKLFETTKWNK